MFIYQIDKLTIRGIVEHDTPVNFKGDTIQPVQFSKVGFSNRYSVPEATKVKLRGTITNRKGDNPAYKLNEFIKLGGIPYIDVIGYLPNNFCDTEDVVYWFHTYGMITSVDRNYKLDTSNGYDQFAIMELNLELIINPFWTPLNRYQWFPYYQADVPDIFILNDINESDRSDFDYDDTVIQEMVSGVELGSGTTPLYQIPTVLDWHFETPFTFHKNSTYDLKGLYNPAYWEKWAITDQGYGIDEDDEVNNFVITNQFSGDVLYYHYFTDLNTTDEIIVEVQSEFGNTLLVNVSTLDIDQVNNVLGTDEFGNTSLAGKKVVITNDGLYPSFILNASYEMITSNVTGQVYQPEWEYNTRFPGELFNQRNLVILNDGDERTYNYAGLFLYRAL